MDNVKNLQCICCGRIFATDAGILTCPDCGMAGILDVIYDYL